MTIEEKFAKLTAGKRQNLNMVWLTNAKMNANDPDNPVLVEVPVKQFTKLNNSWVKQGYTKFVPVKVAPAPLEAKATAKPTNPEPVKN